MGDGTTPVVAPACARCGVTPGPEDRVDTSDRAFCRPCFVLLEAELQGALASMSRDVAYGRAAVGAVLGGAAGAAAWWAFTVFTKIAFGLVAVAIGVLVGKGTVTFAGGKRSRGLQMLSATVALVAFVVASYLVNMTFINQALEQQGQPWRLGFPPPSIAVFWWALSLNFGIMELVFAALTLYQAWVLPQPLAVPGRRTA
jgi:hypothetical protein